MIKPAPSDAHKDCPPAQAGDGRGAERVIRSEELLHRAGRVIIEHKGERYALRETRLGKLILTK